MIHERILESDAAFGVGEEDEEVYGSSGGGRGGGGGGGSNRVATRLVVSRMHVGCLLGKGGKIIEQMRMDTKTQIRILPRDHNLPRCVSMSEEIVQVQVATNKKRKNTKKLGFFLFFIFCIWCFIELHACSEKPGTL